MKKTRLQNLVAYQFHQFQKFSDSVNHAVFTRHGGCSKSPFDTLNVRYGIGDFIDDVTKNRVVISNALAVPFENIISADQTHSKNVLVIDNKFLASHKADTEIPDVDALVTNIPNLPLMIQVADCQAILMFDPKKQVIAAIHAGWKGLAKDISGETINIMQELYGVDPEHILVGISPSLGPCCAFFSNPAEELPQSFQKYIVDLKERRVDLWEYSIDQLIRHGIKKNNIENARVCTVCDTKEFFSFRGDKGITGRFGAVLYLRPQT